MMQIEIPTGVECPETFVKSLQPAELSQALRERQSLRYSGEIARGIDHAIHDLFAGYPFSPALKLMSITDELTRAIFHRTTSTGMMGFWQERYLGINKPDLSGRMAWGVVYVLPNSSAGELWLPIASTSIEYLEPLDAAAIKCFRLEGPYARLVPVPEMMELALGVLFGRWTFRFRFLSDVVQYLPSFQKSNIPNTALNQILPMNVFVAQSRRLIMRGLLKAGFSDQTLMISEQRGILPLLDRFYEQIGFGSNFGEELDLSTEISLAQLLYMDPNAEALDKLLEVVKRAFAVADRQDRRDRNYLRQIRLQELLHINIAQLELADLRRGYPLALFVKEPQPQSGAAAKIFEQWGIGVPLEKHASHQRLGPVFAAPFRVVAGVENQRC